MTSEQIWDELPLGLANVLTLGSGWSIRTIKRGRSYIDPGLALC